MRCASSTATVRYRCCWPAKPTHKTTPPNEPCRSSSSSKGHRAWPGVSCSSRTTTSTWPAELVAGCDLWVNLPRPPLEASGTSGMKAALNGVLNLSVLDGWWAEMYDGTNGWAIDGDVNPDGDAQDRAPRRQRCTTSSSTTSSRPSSTATSG